MTKPKGSNPSRTTSTGISAASSRQQTDTGGEPPVQAALPECSANVLSPYIRVQRIEPTKRGPTREVLSPSAPPMSPSLMATTMRTRGSMIVPGLSATLYHSVPRQQRQAPELPQHRTTGLPGACHQQEQLLSSSLLPSGPCSRSSTSEEDVLQNAAAQHAAIATIGTTRRPSSLPSSSEQEQYQFSLHQHPNERLMMTKTMTTTTPRTTMA
jgi:hypothetical protein